MCRSIPTNFDLVGVLYVDKPFEKYHVDRLQIYWLKKQLTEDDAWIVKQTNASGCCCSAPLVCYVR